MKPLIQKLVEAIGPSGYESAVREIIRAEIIDFVDGIHVDALGNLIARKGHKASGGKKVMLSAHMDEIGVIATHIDNNGFVRFTTIGGVRPHTLYGSRVTFINGVQGVIGAERLEDAAKVNTIEQLFIDVGADQRKTCPVNVGDVAGFQRPYLDLGKRLSAKSMDDRIGVAVLIDVLKSIKKTQHELFFVFSTQEEVGLRGATTAAYSIDPEIGISVDVTLTGDTPKGVKMVVALGKGPAIKVRDGGMLSDPRIVRLMVETAEKAKIPFQMEILEAGTTDAKAMQISRAGMPAGCISIPCRYVHSPSETVDYSDVQNASRLLLALVNGPLNIK